MRRLAAHSIQEIFYWPIWDKLGRTSTPYRTRPFREQRKKSNSHFRTAIRQIRVWKSVHHPKFGLTPERLLCCINQGTGSFSFTLNSPFYARFRFSTCLFWGFVESQSKSWYVHNDNVHENSSKMKIYWRKFGIFSGVRSPMWVKIRIVLSVTDPSYGMWNIAWWPEICQTIRSFANKGTIWNLEGKYQT